MDLSKEEIEEEITAIQNVIDAHEAQLETHLKGIKAMKFNKILFERELEKFK